MTKTYVLQVKNGDLLQQINDFLKALLQSQLADAILVSHESPSGTSALASLIKTEEAMDNANPLVPLQPLNCATLLSQLTVDKPQTKIAAVLRSCEVRAAIELIKLKQINPENLIIIAIDCLGTYEPPVYKQLLTKHKDTTALTSDYLSSKNNSDNDQLRLACRCCEFPTAENADIAINFLGCDIKKQIFIRCSEKLNNIDCESLGLSPVDDISAWEKATADLSQNRIKFRDELFKQTEKQMADIKSFMKELEHCRRCGNCRKACPICYCHECIFDSRTFEHTSSQYFNWADKKGKIRMPTDTLLFHLTRMNHMAVSCIGCGQCSSACPNVIDVAKFFKTVASKVQQIFDYQAGASLEQEIPQSTFKEDEFPEIGKSG